MFLYLRNNSNANPHLCLVPDNIAFPGAVFVPYMDAPLMQLPKTPEALRALRSSKYWRQTNRVNRKFDTEHGRAIFEMVTDKEQLNHWLPAVHDLFKERWADSYTGSVWNTDEGFSLYETAIKQLAAENFASLAVLYHESSGELLSFSYNLHKDGTLYFYQHAASANELYRKFGLGRRLLNNVIEYLVADPEFDHLDFMIGMQSYKLEWATSVQRVYSVHVKDAYESSAAHKLAIGKARLVYAIRKFSFTRNIVRHTLAAVERTRGVRV